MKATIKWSLRLRGLIEAISRYPVTTAFLLAPAIIDGLAIQTGKGYSKLILACAVGAILSAALQALWERFAYDNQRRVILMVSGVFITTGYYAIIRIVPELSEEIGIRTLVAMLALFFAFIWIPVIKSKYNFNESFMAVFKGFFHSAFYAAILFVGCALIIAAINLLITNVDEKAYMHTANLVFILFAPIFFLSKIPVYPGLKDKELKEETLAGREDFTSQAVCCPKFLEVLISYIVIPLSAVYTVILLLYIVLNIRGEFWSNNLLEPLLVTYAIAVIVVYILASSLTNRIAALFRMIFPKVLVPIVVFQVISSTLSLSQTGITHTRYYVILFGIFATLAGIVMSIVPIRKNGILAGLLIGFCIWSIVPPVDAFTISQYSQIQMLKSTLTKNDMLKENVILPKATISDEDKKKIVLAAEYLNRMNYTNGISWFPKDFSIYDDFYDTFGFYEYQIPEKGNRSIYVSHNMEQPSDIAGYDMLVRTSINSNDSQEFKLGEIPWDGVTYTFSKEQDGKQYNLILRDNNKQEIIRFDSEDIFSRYNSYAASNSELSAQDASFVTENDKVKMLVMVQEANINISVQDTYYYADVYVLLQFK